MASEDTPLDPDIAVEDLVRLVPRAPAILRRWNLVCIQCGEPVWGTLAELAADKGVTGELPAILTELESARAGSGDRDA